jgi:hypothetical protein
MLLANAGVVRGTRDAAPLAWKRFVALLLDRCRAEGAHPLPPTAARPGVPGHAPARPPRRP